MLSQLKGQSHVTVTIKPSHFLVKVNIEVKVRDEFFLVNLVYLL